MCLPRHSAERVSVSVSRRALLLSNQLLVAVFSMATIYAVVYFLLMVRCFSPHS